ncbi:cold shock domain-containing protein [Streptomyces sp. NPDC051657]|uniref:cold-shock protein n=1 Tax=unclassified Streptomyces TaxID=2593676 RepID=UPI003442E1EE
MPQGIVARYNPVLGHGTIAADDGAPLFVHSSAFSAEEVETVADGDRVEFAVIQGRDGRSQATDVRKL